jgi:hypothetical protein
MLFVTGTNYLQNAKEDGIKLKFISKLPIYLVECNLISEPLLSSCLNLVFFKMKALIAKWHKAYQRKETCGRNLGCRLFFKMKIKSTLFQFPQFSDRMKTLLPFLVYFLGMCPLGYWQNDLRALLGDWLSFVAVLGYLFILRLIGWVLVQFVDFRYMKSITEHNRLVEDRKLKKKSGKNIT